MLIFETLTLLCLTSGVNAATRRRSTAAAATNARSSSRRTSSDTPAVTASSSSRRTSSGTPTVTAFVGNYPGGWKASAVAVTGCDTTLQLVCDGSGNDLCRSNSGVTVAATQKPSSYELYYSTSGSAITDRCVLASETQAVCTATVSVSSGVITNSPATITSVAYDRIPVTAGTEKLSKAAALCTVLPTGNGAADFGLPGLYKVVAPLGAGVVAAMAM